MTWSTWVRCSDAQREHRACSDGRCSHPEHDERGRLLAVFDALDAYRSTPAGSRWCAFLGAAAEYGDAPEDVRAVLDLETGALRSRLTERALPVVGVRAEALTDQLLLVVSGYLAMRLRDPGLGTGTARSIAAALL